MNRLVREYLGLVAFLWIGATGAVIYKSGGWVVWFGTLALMAIIALLLVGVQEAGEHMRREQKNRRPPSA
jgi:hypothetical protein